MNTSLIADQQASQHRAVVVGMYENLKHGNGEAVLMALSEEIAWTVPPGLPYGGTYRGREAVLNNVFSRFDAEWEGFEVGSDEIFAIGAVVIALGHYAGTRRETGKTMRARFAHVWRFTDGVPVAFETIPDTHTMVAAMS